MHQFDAMNRETDPPVFVSEYAVVGGGGEGNLKVGNSSHQRAMQSCAANRITGLLNRCRNFAGADQKKARPKK